MVNSNRIECAPYFEEVKRAYCFGLVCPSVRPSVLHAFETAHILGTMYARNLKFRICIAYETLADPYFWQAIRDPCEDDWINP